jgi:GNAT superfamily N-acetyltransferase
VNALIGIEAPRQPELLELMRQGDEFTLGLYPPESAHLLGVEGLEVPGVTVFVARVGAAAAGMAALVEGADGTAELKRMFVPPVARGSGIAAALIEAIEKFASTRRIHLIQLETGPLQDAAIRLYERSGYTLIPNFGKYAGDPNSVCYEKALTAGDALPDVP